jgi:hypothetical protein
MTTPMPFRTHGFTGAKAHLFISSSFRRTVPIPKLICLNLNPIPDDAQSGLAAVRVISADDTHSGTSTQTERWRVLSNPFVLSYSS